jgi:hypothetical protein
LLNRNKAATGPGSNANVVIKKEYKPITSYKPSGNLVYEEELLSKIEDKFL